MSPSFDTRLPLLAVVFAVAIPAGASAQITWTQLSPVHAPSSRLFSGGYGYDTWRERMVLFGGHENASSALLNDTWEWDGKDWTRCSPARSPSPRSGATMAFDSARGVCVLFGGRALDSTLLGDTWEWDGTNWRQYSPMNSPSPRHRAAMYFHPQGSRCVIFGGYVSGSTATRELWDFDGVQWTERPLSSPWPGPTADHGIAFDAQRGRAVMYGTPGVR